jgi:hypothetical protein
LNSFAIQTMGGLEDGLSRAAVLYKVRKGNSLYGWHGHANTISMEGFCIGRVRSACHSGTHLHKASQLLGSHRVSRVRRSAPSSRIAHVLFKTTSFISASPHTPCSKQYLHRREIAIPLQRRIGISHPSTEQSGSATQLKRRSTGSQEFIGTCTTLVSVAVLSFGP